MKLRNYSTEGIILSRRNYGEADRYLTLYSRHFGKLTLLAKGIRKIKSKKRGHLEIFSNIKFSAVKGKGMDIMTEATTLNDFPKVRTNLSKITLAYYFCEVVAKITQEDAHPSGIYSLLIISLKQLGEQTKLKKLRLEFIYKLLTEMGYWPEDRSLIDADFVLEDILERKINSVRVGKKILN